LLLLLLLLLLLHKFAVPDGGWWQLFAASVLLISCRAVDSCAGRTAITSPCQQRGTKFATTARVLRRSCSISTASIAAAMSCVEHMSLCTSLSSKSSAANVTSVFTRAGPGAHAEVSPAKGNASRHFTPYHRIHSHPQHIVA
jgi:hypothetical protein